MQAHPLGPLQPLAEFKQFIPVRLVPLPDGKVDKLPIDYQTGKVTPKGSGGAHNPAVWLTYEAAALCAEGYALATGLRHGVGFVLTDDDPFICVDIDGCLQPDGNWSPLALDLYRSLPGAVVEVSQSGRGLHIWCRSASPIEHGKKNVALGLECYSSLRFILLGSVANGTMADDCPDIRDVVAKYFPPPLAGGVDVPDDGPRADWNGPEDDEELLRRAMQSKSAVGAFGGKASFADLWHADAGVLTRAYSGDDSAADAALCAHLAFWTGCDQERIERLMRASGLAREKFDRGDYLPRTIAFVCSRQREVLRDKRPPPAVTLASAIEQIAGVDADQARSMWLGLALQLSRADAETFIDRVTTTISVGRQALKGTLSEARAAARIKQQQNDFAELVGDHLAIQWHPDTCTSIAHQIEAQIIATAKPGEYVAFAGVLCHVVNKPLPCTHLIDDPDAEPPAVPQIEPLGKVAMLDRVERVVKLYELKNDRTKKLIAVPPIVLEVLIGKRDHAAPNVNGLVTHSIVLPDGTILATNGLHQRSGLYLAGIGDVDARPYTQAEAVNALQRLRDTFLDGFEFATPADEDNALAGLLTGVQRRLLDSAPGLAVLASTQSSGKTTLARRIHIILTGRDMPASTFALGNESEVRKSLLAMLMCNPAMVCFDNIQDGFTFASGTLALAMTSATFDERILGISRIMSVPTNVLFTMTGNNLSLGNDEVTRWLVTRLAPRTSRPQERKFHHPDVVAHGLSIRSAVLRDVVGIVAGSLVAGVTLTTRGTRFPMWDRMVRLPLLWAGASDVADAFRKNAAESDNARAHQALLWSLHHTFKGQGFKAADLRTLVQAIPPHDVDLGALGKVTTKHAPTVRSALESIKVKMDGRDMAMSIGNRLSDRIGRVAEVEGQEMMLSKQVDTHDKITRFSVVSAGFAGF